MIRERRNKEKLASYYKKLKIDLTTDPIAYARKLYVK